MDADRPLKELFRLRPRDLLALVGDVGATLVSTQMAELQSLSHRVDTVLRLDELQVANAPANRHVELVSEDDALEVDAILLSERPRRMPFFELTADLMTPVPP